VEKGREGKGEVGGRTMSVVLVMMDTRPASVPPGARASRVEYPQLSFELNRRYACAHGYHLLYLRMKGESCSHVSYGTRHPSYCKLAAIGEALARGYEWAVWLDRCVRERRVRLHFTPQRVGLPLSHSAP